MGVPKDLPSTLAALRDAAVEHAVSGAPLPEAVKKMVSWFEVNGQYEYEFSAVDLRQIAYHYFNDDEARGHGDFTVDQALTDADRVEVARSIIEREISEGDSPLLVGFNIARDDGAAAIFWCETYPGGQAGPEYRFAGAYRTAEECHAVFRQRGYLIDPDPSEIPDEKILKLWRYPRAKSRRKSARIMKTMRIADQNCSRAPSVATPALSGGLGGKRFEATQDSAGRKIYEPQSLGWLRRPELDYPKLETWEKPDGSLHVHDPKQGKLMLLMSKQSELDPRGNSGPLKQKSQKRSRTIKGIRASRKAIRLVIDLKTKALINPDRHGEQDDFDYTNAEHFALNLSKLKRLGREAALAYVIEALDERGSEYPDFLEDETLKTAEWRSKLNAWAKAQIDQNEAMHLAENTPWPVFRDGIELMRAISADKKSKKLICEIDLRGSPGGGSVWAARAEGAIAEINAAIQRLKLDFEIVPEPQDLSEIIRGW